MGGSGTTDGLCGWRSVFFINEIALMFFCAALWVFHRSVVTFERTTLIYPPSLFLFLSLSSPPTLSCFSFSGSCQSLSFSRICSLPSPQLKVTLFSSSSACLWQKGTMGKAWLSFVQLHTLVCFSPLILHNNRQTWNIFATPHQPSPQGLRDLGEMEFTSFTSQYTSHILMQQTRY